MINYEALTEGQSLLFIAEITVVDIRQNVLNTYLKIYKS